MTIAKAAAQIMRAHGVNRSVAFSWAWQAFREAQAPIMQKQAEYFERRRQELREQAFLQRLRAAAIISPLAHKAKTARLGGWTIERHEPRTPDQFAA